MSSTDLTGVIKMVNHDKGFGFIRRENDTDLFFHVTECVDKTEFESMSSGKEVTYSTGAGKRGIEGRDVKLV